MYKILIKHNTNANKSDTTIWRMYGSTTTTNAKTTFTEFATDDIETLKAEILALDSVYGSENIRVIKEIDTNYNVDVVTDDSTEPSEPTEPNPDTPSEDVTEDENAGE
jgi:hypothetical protein